MKRILTAIIATAAMLGIAKELALPAVPSDLRIPALRADYIGAHFWDAMDWTDSMATDPAAVTQNVANCLSVFPHMSGDSARVAAADTFVVRALRAGENSALAASQAIEDCLFASGSELRDEMLYTVFLERMLAAGYPDSARASYMLEMTRKNMPGSQAADFAFTDRDGEKSTLLRFANRPTVLFFYDPGCHNCHDLAMAMADDPILKAKLIAGRIRILAVSPGDGEEWRDHGAWLPSGWTDATDGGTIDDGELYSIGTYPSLYLIGSDGKVILKDCSPADLINTINNL